MNLWNGGILQMKFADKQAACDARFVLRANRVGVVSVRRENRNL